MKYESHVPVEQYGYIAVETDTAEEAVNEYNRIKKMFSSPGIPEPQWRDLLDEYLSTGKVTNGGEFWEDMSELQRAVINEIKKSIKRRG